MFKRGCNGCGEFWYIGNDSTCKCPDETPKREWVGLTDEELVMYSKQFNGISLVSEIEAQLKERNT